MSLVFTQAQKTISSIRNMLPRLVTGGGVIHGEPIIYTEPENVPPVLDFLKMHTGTRCKQLVDITAVDYPTREKRFEVPRNVFLCLRDVLVSVFLFNSFLLWKKGFPPPPPPVE